MVITTLENNGIIPRAANDRVSELMVAPEKKEEFLKEAAELPSVEINKLDLQWVQVLGEGWASPLKGINTVATYFDCGKHPAAQGAICNHSDSK